MYTQLMFRDRAFSPNTNALFGKKDFYPDFSTRWLVKNIIQNTPCDSVQEVCFDHQTLSSDLEISRIISAMAGGDSTIWLSCSASLFQPLTNINEIRYRQQCVKDALQNRNSIRRLYEITLRTENKRGSSWQWLDSPYLSSTYSSAIELLRLYLEMLMEMRKIADTVYDRFVSDGFSRLFSSLKEELPDDYFADAYKLLSDLKEKKKGLIICSEFGSHLQGIHYTLLEPEAKNFRLHWKFAPSYTIPERDNFGAEDLGLRRSRAINEATNTLAQSTEHLMLFFARLRLELAFYVGCINLADELERIGMPLCFPCMESAEQCGRGWENLYDVSLALLKKTPVTGNRLSAEGKKLFLITGANQGGKSTFLRSIGQAQLMMQSGMFVGAEQFIAPIRNGVFSHFKKEEDSAMKSGKLDEELTRMDELANHLKYNSLVLFNESFAATNEREGSEICRQITQALLDSGMEVFSVSHLYTYAASFSDSEETQCLSAERTEDGTRTFHIVPGKPQQTAFGEDLYKEIYQAPYRVE